MEFNDREEWLDEATSIIFHEWIAPRCGVATAPPIRNGVGSLTGRSTRRTAVCHPRAASADSHNEIVYSPEIDHVPTILATAVHEIIHAIDDCQSGHRGAFATMAKACDLQGPMTATHAGPDLQTFIDQIAPTLGAYPHAALDLSKRKKQSTRMLRVQCLGCPGDVQFVYRTTKKMLELLSPTAAATATSEYAVNEWLHCPRCMHETQHQIGGKA